MRTRTPSSRRPWRPRTRLAGLAIAVAMATLGTMSAPAGAQTFPFGTPGYGGTATASGNSVKIALVGDSLIYSSNGGTTLSGMANNLKTVTGRTSVVNAYSGALWMTYAWPGQQNGNPVVWDLANFVDARLTVGALATNDARIMTQYPGSYNQQQQYAVMQHGVQQTLQHSNCVMLVNVKARTVPKGDGSGVGMSAAVANQVNDNMTWLAATTPGVYVANWNAYASTSWFIPNDVHLTGSGAWYYADFISSSAKNLITNHNC